MASQRYPHTMFYFSTKLFPNHWWCAQQHLMDTQLLKLKYLHWWHTKTAMFQISYKKKRTRITTNSFFHITPESHETVLSQSVLKWQFYDIITWTKIFKMKPYYYEKEARKRVNSEFWAKIYKLESDFNKKTYSKKIEIKYSKVGYIISGKAYSFRVVSIYKSNRW